MRIRKMEMSDYEGVYNLWLKAPGMGLNAEDGSREGIEKYLRRNPKRGGYKQSRPGRI